MYQEKEIELYNKISHLSTDNYTLNFIEETEIVNYKKAYKEKEARLKQEEEVNKAETSRIKDQDEMEVNDNDKNTITKVKMTKDTNRASIVKKFRCILCKEEKPKLEFSGSQMKKKKEAMICKTCIIDSYKMESVNDEENKEANSKCE